MRNVKKKTKVAKLHRSQVAFKSYQVQKMEFFIVHSETKLYTLYYIRFCPILMKIVTKPKFYNSTD